ncbi:MAG: hypothetical protein J3Q66DRAFT_346255 [Benniella sp.]|nr:MAG: hypothetical protein J3Q66DRAFT_346255 [Benniella sp.]
MPRSQGFTKSITTYATKKKKKVQYQIGTLESFIRSSQVELKTPTATDEMIHHWWIGNGGVRSPHFLCLTRAATRVKAQRMIRGRKRTSNLMDVSRMGKLDDINQAVHQFLFAFNKQDPFEISIHEKLGLQKPPSSSLSSNMSGQPWTKLIWEHLKGGRSPFPVSHVVNIFHTIGKRHTSFWREESRNPYTTAPFRTQGRETRELLVMEVKRVGAN